MTTTQWYPANVHPVRDGLYETRVGGGLTWSVWEGGFWLFASTEKEECLRMAAQGSKSFWQLREWRGLTEHAA